MSKLLLKTTITIFLAFGFIVTNAQSIADIQAQIQALLTQVDALQNQLKQVSGGCDFKRDLFSGLRGDEVKCLQEYLTSTGYSVSNTGFFGPLTKDTVSRWQSANRVLPAAGYFGQLSRKKYQELTVIAATPETPAPVSQEAPTATPTPTQESTPVAPPTVSPKDAIKTGTGTAENNSYITIETGKFYYTGITDNNRGYLASADPEVFIASLSGSEDISNCETNKAYSYLGPASICSFTDASKYTFTSLPKEGVRFYDKIATKGGYSCNNGIILFKQNGQYGGIDFEKVDKESRLTYQYWIDKSGGTNFGTLCSSRADKSVLASIISALGSLRSVLIGLFR